IISLVSRSPAQLEALGLGAVVRVVFRQLVPAHLVGSAVRLARRMLLATPALELTDDRKSEARARPHRRLVVPRRVSPTKSSLWSREPSNLVRLGPVRDRWSVRLRPRFAGTLTPLTIRPLAELSQ